MRGTRLHPGQVNPRLEMRKAPHTARASHSDITFRPRLTNVSAAVSAGGPYAFPAANSFTPTRCRMESTVAGTREVSQIMSREGRHSSFTCESTMKKLRLQIEQLQVDSFSTATEAPAEGTVRGHCPTLQESGCATHEYSCAGSCGSCVWTCQHSCIQYSCGTCDIKLCTGGLDCPTSLGCGGGGGGGGGGSGPGTGCEAQPY